MWSWPYIGVGDEGQGWGILPLPKKSGKYNIFRANIVWNSGILLIFFIHIFSGKNGLPPKLIELLRQTAVAVSSVHSGHTSCHKFCDIAMVVRIVRSVLADCCLWEHDQWSTSSTTRQIEHRLQQQQQQQQASLRRIRLFTMFITTATNKHSWSQYLRIVITSVCWFVHSLVRDAFFDFSKSASPSFMFNICAKILLLTFQKSRSKFKIKTAVLKIFRHSSAVVEDIFTKLGNPTEVGVILAWNMTVDKIEDGGLVEVYPVQVLSSYLMQKQNKDRPTQLCKI